MSYQQPPPPPEGYGYQQPPPPPPSYGYQAPAAALDYANWGYRVGSYLIDSIVGSIPIVIAYVIGIALIAAASQSNSGALGAIGFLVIFVGALASLGIGIWNQCIRQGTTGQSIGKQVLHTRLVSVQTGQPIGGGMAFVRILCHIVDGIPCYIGYLWPLWDPQRQTFADKIVNTVVVRTA
jgi:uncharacterized RDD family membrane protein YckC